MCHSFYCIRTLSCLITSSKDDQDDWGSMYNIERYHASDSDIPQNQRRIEIKDKCPK